MPDRFLLSPFFLDQPAPDLEAPFLAEESHRAWTVNRPELAQGGSDGDHTAARMSVYHRSLANLVATAIHAGERPVSIADCCSTLAMMAGLHRAGVEPALLWLDAHGDFNTFETSPSGFLGGMPLAMLVGRGDQSLMDALDLAPFPEDRVVLTDARDLDPGERETLVASQVLHVGDPARLLSSPMPPGPLYVHFDVDIVDIEDAPAMAYAAPGGRRADELHAVFTELAATRDIVAVSLSPWRPDHEGAERTRRTAMDLLSALLS